MESWEAEMIREFVLFEIGEAHGCKGVEERRTGVYAFVVYGVPYLAVV